MVLPALVLVASPVVSLTSTFHCYGDCSDPVCIPSLYASRMFSHVSTVEECDATEVSPMYCCRVQKISL